MSRVIMAFGGGGKGKSTFAGSGTGRKWYCEFDAGSFRRANFQHSDLFEVHKYYAPLTNILSMGKISVSDKGGATPITVQKLSGWKELFWQFVTDYLAALDQDFEDYIFDTSTKLWLIVRQGFQQETQEATGDAQKRLDALHYTEPNARMSQIIEASQIKEKNLILVEHEKEVYIGDKPSGFFQPDGFKDVPDLADATLRFTLQQNHPVGEIVKAGAGGLSLIDMRIDSPTLPGVLGLLDAAEAIRAVGLPVPAEFDAVMELAKGLQPLALH